MRRYFDLASRTSVLATTFVATAALVLLVFPALSIDMLDTRTGGYGYEEVVAAMDGYGEDGRRMYAWASVFLDTLLPVVYATFLAGWFRRFETQGWLRYLEYAPLVLLVVDLLENAQIVAMLVQYPMMTDAQVAMASATTVAKSYLFAGCVGYGLALTVLAGVRRLRSRARA